MIQIENLMQQYHKEMFFSDQTLEKIITAIEKQKFDDIEKIKNNYNKYKEQISINNKNFDDIIEAIDNQNIEKLRSILENVKNEIKYKKEINIKNQLNKITQMLTVVQDKSIEKQIKKRIDELIIQTYIFGSLYSFNYSIYELGSRFQKKIYDPFLLSNLTDYEARLMKKIYNEGKIDEDVYSEFKSEIENLIQKELCFKKEKYFYLTQKGLILVRDQWRLIDCIAFPIKCNLYGYPVDDLSNKTYQIVKEFTAELDKKVEINDLNFKIF